MKPHLSDRTSNRFCHVPTNTNVSTAPRRSSSPINDSNYTPFSNQYSGRVPPYPFYGGPPGSYLPQHKGGDQRSGTQYQSSSSTRPPDLLNVPRTVEVTRAGPAQALSSIVTPPASQIITSHRVSDHSEGSASNAPTTSGSLRRFPVGRPGSKPRNGSSRGSPRATPSLIKAEAPTTLGASMTGNDCFSTAEEPVPYALTNHPIFSEDLKKACTPIRKVENPFATQKKSNMQSVYGEYEIQRHRNDIMASHFAESQLSSSKLGIHPYPNGVKDMSVGRNDYPFGASCSNLQERQGGALDLSIKSVRQSPDSPVLELNSSFSNSDLYLGKGSRDVAKQTMPYDYSYSPHSVKRKPDEIDHNVIRNKYHKVSPSPNNVLPRQLDAPRNNQANVSFSSSKVAEHLELRPAYEASTFTQAHTSLTMPYGRQVQSANSSGYFSEGISESGVAFTPPVSPRIRPSTRMPEKDKMEQKVVELEPYFPQVRPNSKNSPYNAYAGQYSNVYDRSRVDESLKFNSQSSYNNSHQGYYPGYPVDRYPSGLSVPDNSSAFRSNSCNYAKPNEVSIASRQSYANYFKNTQQAQPFTDPKPLYRQPIKTEVIPRSEVKRQPRIEIASQPINLVEDNEISIEKTQNDTISSENFTSIESFPNEVNSFQSIPVRKEVKPIGDNGRADIISSKGNTSSCKMSTEHFSEQVMTGTQVHHSKNELNENKSSVMDEKKGKISDQNWMSQHDRENSKKIVRNVEKYNNQPGSQTSSETLKNSNHGDIVIHKVENANSEKPDSDISTSTDTKNTGDMISDSGKNRELSLQHSSPNATNKVNILQITSTIMGETAKENVPCKMTKEMEIKEEKDEIKLEPGQCEYIPNEIQGLKRINKEVLSQSKVNYADINSLKEYSPTKSTTHLLPKKDKNFGKTVISNVNEPNSVGLNYKKSEIVQPVLNLSLSTSQGGIISNKPVEDIPRMPNSHITRTREVYQNIPVSNYDDVKSHNVSNFHQNNVYIPRSQSSQTLTTYSPIDRSSKLMSTNSTYHTDSMVYAMRQGVSTNNRSLYQHQFNTKAEVYGTLQHQQNLSQPYAGHGFVKHAHSSNIEAGSVDTSLKAHRDVKDQNVTYSIGDGMTDKSKLSKQIPLAINPRVLSPWNSSVPHSIAMNNRKTPISGSSQLSNDFLRDASPQIKDMSENEKKLRLTPSSTYPHGSYGSQYPYNLNETTISSPFSANTQADRTQSYAYESKPATYIPPTCAYTKESLSYKPYTPVSSLGNVPSASHQFNSSTSIGNRPLLSPHSPPHPPPPRLESSHHQSMYYPTAYNTSFPSRTIAEQYTRTSPHYPSPSDAAKYQSREYSPYTYKGSYGHQTTLDRISYSSPSPYYAHQPYNVSSSQRTSEQHDYSKAGTFDYAGDQQGHVKFSQEPSFAQERLSYQHTTGYSYPSGSTHKDFTSNKSALPPAAHLSQSSLEYKPTSYDNSQSLHTSSQNSMNYRNQEYEQKGYFPSKQSNQPNQIIPSSYPYSMPKSSHEEFEHPVDGVAIRSESDVAQYSLPYRRSYERTSAEVISKTPHTSINQNVTTGDAINPKEEISTSGEYKYRDETFNRVSMDEKSNFITATAEPKTSNSKTISNPVQPLYSSWANYRTHLPDVPNRQVLKPRSLDTLQNAPQKFRSFKNDKESLDKISKTYQATSPFLGRVRVSSLSNSNKDMPLKEQIPFSRPDHYAKGLSRTPLTTDPKQSAVSEDIKPIPVQESNVTELNFDDVMSAFESDLTSNRDVITSKKSLILAKRYANRVESQLSAAGMFEEEIESFDESESDAEPPLKFRGKIKSIKGKKAERFILTYASHSDDSATEMIADEDESDFEEELVKEIQAKARKGRSKDKSDHYKENADDSDVSSADRTMRSSKQKSESTQHRKDLSSNNSTDTSSDSSEESNSSYTSESVIRLKKKVSEVSSSDCDTRKTVTTRSKIQNSKELKLDVVEHSKVVTRRRMRRGQHLSDLSDEEIKPKKLRIAPKCYSSNSDDRENDTHGSSTDCDSRLGKEKEMSLLLESDTDEDSQSVASSPKNDTKDASLMDDPILSKLESQRELESSRSDVIEMKAWKLKTREQAVALLKSLPPMPLRYSWRRPSFSGVFKKGWQKELRKFKIHTVRTPEQLVSIPSTPGSVYRRRGRGITKGSAMGRGQTKDSKDGLNSKTMMRRYFEKVLMNGNKDEESLSGASSSPFSTFTPTGLTPTPSVSPSMLVAGTGSNDSDKDSLNSIRGASPPASDSATLRRRSIATTIMHKIQRQQYKGRGLEAPWLNRPRSVMKGNSQSLMLPRSISNDGASGSNGKKNRNISCIRSIFGDDPSPELEHDKLLNKFPKRRKYFSPISSTTHSTSSTPSTPVGADEVGIVASRKRKMKKFRSGFDYIPRKKKKLKPLEEMGSRARKKVIARRRRQWPESSRDVATEVKTWVINKGLGETALHRAARLQYHDVVIYCLESKEFNVNARDNAGYTPLHEACNRGHLDVAQALCSFGAHVNAPGYGGMRPLHEACDNGHVELVRLLLSFGADINLSSYGGQSCLSLASDSQCSPFVLDFTNDLRGKKAKPWMFSGPARLFDLEEQGADFFTHIVYENETAQNDSMIFETSESLLPDIYIIEGFLGSFVLLNELLFNLNCSYNDLIKEAGKIETVFLSKKEFKKRTQCCSRSNTDEFPVKLNAEVVLVKYTKRLQTLLGVEVVTVT